MASKRLSVHVYLTEQEHEELEEMALARRISVSGLCGQIIGRYLDETRPLGKARPAEPKRYRASRDVAVGLARIGRRSAG